MTIYVGNGAEIRTLPNLKGKTLDDALQTITDLDLPAPKTVPTTSTQPTNTVVRTDARPAGPVAPDQVVTILLLERPGQRARTSSAWPTTAPRPS